MRIGVTPQNVTSTFRNLLYNEICPIIEFYQDVRKIKIRKIRFNDDILYLRIVSRNERTVNDLFYELKYAISFVLHLMPSLSIENLYFRYDREFYLEEFDIVDIFQRKIANIYLKKEVKLKHEIKPFYFVVFRVEFLP